MNSKHKHGNVKNEKNSNLYRSDKAFMFNFNIIVL